MTKSGDNIFMSKEPTRSMEMAFAPVIERGVPWAAVFGNHDDEQVALCMCS